MKEVEVEAVTKGKSGGQGTGIKKFRGVGRESRIRGKRGDRENRGFSQIVT